MLDREAVAAHGPPAHDQQQDRHRGQQRRQHEGQVLALLQLGHPVAGLGVRRVGRRGHELLDAVEQLLGRARSATVPSLPGSARAPSIMRSNATSNGSTSVAAWAAAALPPRSACRRMAVRATRSRARAASTGAAVRRTGIELEPQGVDLDVGHGVAGVVEHDAHLHRGARGVGQALAHQGQRGAEHRRAHQHRGEAHDRGAHRPQPGQAGTGRRARSTDDRHTQLYRHAD